MGSRFGFRLRWAPPGRSSLVASARRRGRETRLGSSID